MLPNGRSASDWPRVIEERRRGVAGGQKSPLMSGSGQVRSARSPPELVIAKSTPIGGVRRAHGVRHDIADEGLTEPPVAVAALVGPAGSRLVESPIFVLRIGASWAVRSSISAWIAGSGVRPMSHGLW